MRILFVSHLALPHIGGIETAIDEIASHLAALGHEVTHASGLPATDERPETEPGRAYRFVRLPTMNPLERRFGVPVPLHEPFALSRVLRREIARTDALHCHGMLQQASCFALALARSRPELPRVLTEHVAHVPYSNPLLDFAERVAIASLGRFTTRLADGIITYNSRVAEQLQRLAPRHPIFHVENGVNVDRFRPPTDSERRALRERLGWDDAPRVLFVGRLVEKKGAALAVAAAERGGFHLALAGPGEPPRDAARNPRITLLGPVSPETMPDIYRAADLFLLPSRGEGFPLTAQEAMACGLPIVLGDDPGYRKTLAGAEHVVRLAASDPDAVARAVAELLDVKDARDRSSAFARARFSWDQAAKRHLEIYEILRQTRQQAAAS